MSGLKSEASSSGGCHHKSSVPHSTWISLYITHLSLQVINARVASNAISAFHLAFYKAALPVMIQRLEMLPPG